MMNENILPEELMDFAFVPKSSSELKVIGVGGGGCNAVNHMYGLDATDVQFIVCNTDSQALANSPVPYKIQLGETLTRGRGAGSDPQIGRQAAIESIGQITDLVKENTDMVFITAGMGGGTGTGAAPVIAEKIKELDILTVAIVTVPFSSEIGDRVTFARQGIEELNENVDALIIIENDKLNKNYSDLPLSEAFRMADEVLAVAAKSIVEIIKIHGQWNVDFNDVKTVMKDSKVALMGAGYAAGESRAIEAVQNAISSPLLNNSDITGATNILVNIVSGKNEILVREHDEICQYIQEISGRESKQFIIGVARDESLEDEIKVTIIATGFKVKMYYDLWERQKNELSSAPVPEAEEPEEALTESETLENELPIKEIPIKKRKESKKKSDEENGRKSGIQRFIDFFDEGIN
jgi:cell division protein FtsZ